MMIFYSLQFHTNFESHMKNKINTIELFQGWDTSGY